MSWYRDDVELERRDVQGGSGPTPLEFTVPNVSFDHAGEYKVTVTNSSGRVESTSCVVMVNPLPQPPVIVQQPMLLNDVAIRQSLEMDIEGMCDLAVMCRARGGPWR